MSTARVNERYFIEASDALDVLSGICLMAALGPVAKDVVIQSEGQKIKIKDVIRIGREPFSEDHDVAVITVWGTIFQLGDKRVFQATFNQDVSDPKVPEFFDCTIVLGRHLPESLHTI